MAQSLQSSTGDLKKISECWLYRDPEVSSRARIHTFCYKCKDTSTITRDDFCPLCRPIFRITGGGYESIPRNYYVEKLVDWHEVQLEEKLNLKKKKIINIPSREQYDPDDVWDDHPIVAWMENELYVTLWSSSSIYVLSDRAPFEQLKERTIEIEEMRRPCSMTASAATRSIFVSDRRIKCIFRIQMPGNEISRWEVDGIPSDLSITGNGELLVGVTGLNEARFPSGHCHLKVFDLTDSTWKVIPLPSEIEIVTSVVQLPNQNFIISYSRPDEEREQPNKEPLQFWVSLLSKDGQTMIKTVNTRFYISINADISPSECIDGFRLAVKNDGQIFATDFSGGSRLLLLNSDLTGCRVLSNNGRRFETWASIVYVKEKQQLFVPGIKRISVVEVYQVISVFQLSPCYNNSITAQQPAN